jgi:spermidine synthase
VTVWFDEKLYKNYRQRYEVTRTIVRKKSRFQDLAIFDSPVHGRVLALDGIIQTTELDEFVYHEMLTHVPILAHGRVRDVLIIGGGDGGILREVLRHKGMRAVMVEIDADVVNLCAKHMPKLNGGAFKNPRGKVLIDDGIKYVADAPSKSFDVIIVDSTDPFGPGEVLFTDAFYADCRRVLRPGGLVVTQNGVPIYQGREIAHTYRRLRRQFKDVSYYVAATPTYVGGFMALGWATDNPKLRTVPLATLRRRFAASGVGKTRYYTPEIHAAAFQLPPFVQAFIPKK